MKVLFAFMFALCFSGSAAAQMTCATPSMQVVDSGTLAQIVVGNDKSLINKTVVDLIREYPNADRVLLQRDLISAVCELIKNSPNTSFAERAKLLLELTKEIQSAFAQRADVILPIGERLVVFTALPSGQLNYRLVMVSATWAFARCEVDGDAVNYGEGMTAKRFFLYDRSDLTRLPDNLGSDPPGNFLLQIPKRLLFEPGDMARSHLEYFRLIKSQHCYVGDVVLHLGVWDTKDNRYIMVKNIQSVTSHGRCAIVISNETSDDFRSISEKYDKFIEKQRGDKRTRHWFSAALHDASRNINDAKEELGKKAANNQLTVNYEVDASYEECMGTTLKAALAAIH
ncbi:hypothetical protein [Mesorhizobium sp. M0715]|uniref:hypothetical protein n=1 Tax=Mesorhizobium sp. M0715 TaxID=2956990 RepID=UPI00333690DF